MRDVTKSEKIRQAHVRLHWKIELVNSDQHVQPIFGRCFCFGCLKLDFISFFCLFVNWFPFMGFDANDSELIFVHWKLLFSIETAKKRNLLSATCFPITIALNLNYSMCLGLFFPPQHSISINFSKRNTIKFMLISMSLGIFYHLIAKKLLPSARLERCVIVHMEYIVPNKIIACRRQLAQCAIFAAAPFDRTFLVTQPVFMMKR